jgi:hypothetical protein
VFDLINYLVAIAKGVLRPEDIQVNQAKTIMKEALVEMQGKIPEEILKNFDREITRYGSSFHISAELDKVIKEFSSKVYFLVTK